MADLQVRTTTEAFHEPALWINQDHIRHPLPADSPQSDVHRRSAKPRRGTVLRSLRRHGVLVQRDADGVWTRWKSRSTRCVSIPAWLLQTLKTLPRRTRSLFLNESS